MAFPLSAAHDIALKPYAFTQVPEGAAVEEIS
jgi:hypothetical protein